MFLKFILLAAELLSEHALSQGGLHYKFSVYFVFFWMVLENPVFISTAVLGETRVAFFTMAKNYIGYNLRKRLLLLEISVAFAGLIIHSHLNVSIES